MLLVEEEFEFELFADWNLTENTEQMLPGNKDVGGQNIEGNLTDRVSCANIFIQYKSDKCYRQRFSFESCELNSMA